jgi:AraC-like DNA-binding protein
MARDLMRGPFPLVSVKLARPRPPRPAYYRKWFGAPVCFEAACNELRFSLDVLDRALPSANASLHTVLERQASAVVRALPDRTSPPAFLERVRMQVSTGIDAGEVSVKDVARQLGMAERTLRRRLEASGTSFRALLDDVRRERALVLTQDPKLNIAEIAQRLGFSGSTSFGRAFQRWTGSKPKAYGRAARAT